LTAALRPLTKGAVTTDDVFAHRLSADDVGRLGQLAKLVESRTQGPLAVVVRQLAAMAGNAAGQSLGEVLGVR
jgi:hypothetical protein